MLNGTRGSLERRRTEPRDAGFIANTATLTSYACAPWGSSPGKKKRSDRPWAQALLEMATVTWAMKSGCERSNAATSRCSLSVPW
jgi:hypothetical protein